MKELAIIALQIFMPLLTAVVTVGSAVVAKRLNDWLGLKNESLLRDALHQAAENGLAYALTRGSNPASGAVIKDALDYVKSKNPQTVKKLRVSDAALVEIIKSKASRVPVR